MILDALKPVAEIINKFIPDGAEKNRLEAELEKASLEVDKQRLGALGNMLGSGSFFVAGAIPSILWVLVISVVNNYILMPWAKVFGYVVPDVGLPSEYWSLCGWIITGLLAKKAVDGNAFYSKDGSLIKPSRSDPSCNTITRMPNFLDEGSSQSIVDDEVRVEPDRVVTSSISKDDPDYMNKRWAELTAKYEVTP